MQQKIHIYFLKIVSITVLAAFASGEMAHASGETARLSPPPASASFSAETLSRNPATLEPPVDFANLREIHRGPKDVLIIHIQDAHSNLSGQQNLAGALDELMAKYGLSLVLVEGSSKE